MADILFMQKIYNYFNNRKGNKKKIARYLKKINPENLWYEDNKALVNKAIDAYVAANDLGATTVATFRKVQCQEWNKQDESVVKYYMALAEERKGLQEAAGPLQGQGRLEYVSALAYFDCANGMS
jgi:hypothetical protein